MSPRHAPLPPLPPWDGDVRAARALQESLAGRVRLVDDARAPRLIGGFDVGFEEKKTITRAAAVLVDARTLEQVAHVVVRQPTRMPYIPGLLSFRELPALLEALESLPRRPDLAFVDGLGIAHPRRFGIAAHFGVASGLPSVGVAKSLYIGTHDEVPDAPGAHVPLRDGAERIGSMVRTKARCRPLVISPGHRVSFDGAVAHVLGALRGYRLPEPTRLADRIASRRDTR